VKWDVVAPKSTPFDKIDLPADINLTTKKLAIKAFHAAANLFYMDPVLADTWPEKKDALHAG
jgi:hypothetical protein